MIRLQTEPFDAGALLAQVSAAAGGAGAVASFTGLVRPATDGRSVEMLELDCYLGLAEQVIGGYVEEAVRRFSLLEALVVHRHGAIAPGEAIVFVAAAAAHRRAAFDAVDFLMDRLKTEAPFWKKEHGPAGGHWIEPRPADYHDAARWAPKDAT
jgi:molybdopterin synthase catalytic subunit